MKTWTLQPSSNWIPGTTEYAMRKSASTGMRCKVSGDPRTPGASSTVTPSSSWVPRQAFHKEVGILVDLWFTLPNSALHLSIVHSSKKCNGCANGCANMLEMGSRLRMRWRWTTMRGRSWKKGKSKNEKPKGLEVWAMGGTWMKKSFGLPASVVANELGLNGAMRSSTFNVPSI